MESFREKLDHRVVGQIFLFALRRGLAGKVADELEVFRTDGVSGVVLRNARKVQSVIGEFCLRQTVGKLVSFEGFGGKLSGATIHFTWAKELCVEKDLQAQDIVDRLGSFRKRVRDGGGGRSSERYEEKDTGD